MNLRCPHLRVLDHFHVVPLYTSPKNPELSVKTLHPAHTLPVHTDLQLLSHSCAALIYCVLTLAASSAHYVPQTQISNSETLVCAIAILAALLACGELGNASGMYWSAYSPSKFWVC